MKQLILGKNKAYASAAKSTDLTSVAEGTIAMFKLSDGSLITGKVDSDFSLVLGRKTNVTPFIIPEVNFKTLTVEKATNQPAKTFTAKMTIANAVAGKNYTIIVVKKGVTRHERNTWTATYMAKSTTVTDVAADLVKQFNGSSETSGITAFNSGGVITFTASVAGTDFDIVGADELTGVKPTAVTNGIPGILDKAYVMDLASRCAAGKGFNYTAQDASEIYPGYPEEVEDTTYTMYTLRFAVPRVAAKQRDEVVYQIVHIVVPSAATVVTTLDTIFDLNSPSSSSVTD